MHRTKIFEQINGHPQYANEKTESLMDSSPTPTAIIYYYIKKFISNKPDFRFKSNFAGTV